MLRDVLATQDVVETTVTLDEQQRRNPQYPLRRQERNASVFDCVFWIETVKEPKTGDETMQLQYSQITNIEFLPQFGRALT